MAGDASAEPPLADVSRPVAAEALRPVTDPRVNNPRVGDVLAERYRIDDFVGSGGMATVFRATDETLGRTVAVKVFVPGTAGRGDEARQVSETRLLASLSHHALVTLFDAHLPERGPAFLVMEYVGGGNLDERLREGRLSPEEAADLAGELGEALHVVHAAGIIHRDVKPSNILLRPALTPHRSIRPTLADFGIAYLIDATRLTAPGTAIGTAAYLAPEQVRGAQPTTASDIYSLGLVLIEALTGRRAFAQQTPIEAIAARLSIQPEVPTDLGHAWRSLLTDMTARDPELRPTALEVAMRSRALEAAASEPDVTVLGPTHGDARAEVAERGASYATETRPFPMTPSGATSGGTPGTTPSATAPTIATAPLAAPGDFGADDGRRPVRRRIFLTAGALALAVIAAIVLWTLNPAPEQPAPPDLPQVGEPLDSHLGDLLETVTP